MRSGPGRAALVVAGLALTTLTIVGMAELTQTRPEDVRAGSATEVVLRISSRSGPAHEPEAARRLWDSCRDQLRGGRQVVGEGLVRTPDGRYRLLVSPALGSHSGRRLTGCLQDARVDFVLARLESVRDLPAPDAGRDPAGPAAEAGPAQEP